MKHFLTALFMTLLFPLFSRGEGPQFREPDFDYPAKVEKEARALLSEAAAMAAPEAGATRLRALVELFAAQTAIDSDSAFTQPAMVAALVDAPNNTPADRAMLLTLQARLYWRILQNAYWRYSQVDAPLAPLPADVSEWSAEQFESEIERLLTEALAIGETATTPLAHYSASVAADSVTLIYLPTVRDFILYQAVEESKEHVKYIDLALRDSGTAKAPYFYWSVQKWLRGADNEKNLYNLYKANADVEPARYVLMQLSSNVGTNTPPTEREREVVDMLRTSLDRFPDWPGNETLKATLARLTAPRANLWCKAFVAPGLEFTVTANYCFASEITVGLYNMAGVSNDAKPEVIMQTRKPESLQRITELPEGKCQLKFTTPKQGKYRLIGCLTAADGRKAYASFDLESTAYLPVVVNGMNKSVVLTAAYTDGAPYAGVKVALKPDAYEERNKPAQALGAVPASGILEFLPKYDYGHLTFTDGGYTTDFYSRLRYHNYKRGLQSIKSYSHSVLVLTDRPIYHPGDSLNWAVVAAMRDDTKHLLPDVAIDVVLLDANRQAVDTVSVTTDAAGRASGSFVIPKGILTGRYTVRATLAEEGKQFDNTVMVSDFRAPVFYAEITSVKRGVPAEGDVRIEGRARTFAGMPVAGAKVKVRLEAARRWWRYYPEVEIETYEITTDTDGAFVIDFTADTLESVEKDDGKPYTDFCATFDVTAPDASTASVTKNFSIGKPYSLSAQLPRSHDASAPLQVTFKAVNADGDQAPLAVQWMIYTDDDMDDLEMFDEDEWDDENPRPKPAAKGKAVCGTPADLKLGSLPAGEYGLVLVPADASLADTTLVPARILLYNVAKNRVPETDTHFFLPKTECQLNADGTASLLIGVQSAATVFTVADLNGEIRNVGSRKLSAGFSTLPVDLGQIGEDFDNASLMIIAVADGETYQSTVALTRPILPEPKLVVETFRDKLVPGTLETWRIRMVDADGRPMPATPAIATMYNRALEQLVPDNWRTAFSLPTFTWQPTCSVVYNYARSLSLMVDGDYFRPFNPEWPQWRFISYDYSIRVRGMRMAKYSTAVATEAPMEYADEGTNAIAYGISDLKGAVGGVQMADNVLYESAVVTEADADEAVADENGATAEPETEFREAEVLQAFWMPSLVADAEGNIDIVFTVPNANATWTFRSLAWTPAAQTASQALEALANKPVMVQPNLPRFLRQGDCARVLATVFNNSGEAAAVTSVVEIFDVNTGELYGSATFSDSIAAGASAIVPVDIVAPTDRPAIGYRVRSRLGAFSDGEQAMIPILASSATVIESTEFYLNPADSEPFTLTVPALSDSASVTLQYCRNPVWTVVRAMRGLGSADGLTSTSLVGKLFSALAARSIIAGNPAIASAISEWSSNPDSRALESMLSRNENLKALLLDQTPWVQTAADQSARMAALANVLNPDRTDAAIREYVEKIVKLQTAGGGIRWTSWASEPSPWSTRTVLTTLGIARSLYMLPTDNQTITELIESAWTYVCAEAAKPKVPDTDFDLAYIASMFPGLKSDATTEKIIRRTVDDIRSSWKGGSLTSKAYAILILKANGLAKEARPIFESIRQFAVDRPGMGKCFPNITDIRSYATIIQAYKAMDAPAAEIDALRQWVIVQAQASDDLFAYNPDYVIAAVMLTGTDWTAVPVAENVTVNGRRLEIDSIESATGYFAQALTPDGRPMEITVTPNGVTPSYGSVITIASLPMQTIESRPGRDLSIEKRVLVERDGRWVETTHFALGERLRVQLIIKAKRALDYVTIDDERPATFEPVDQLPGYVYANGLGFYRENLDASTRLFIGHMPAGTYLVTYDMTANLAGSFISGIATLQSQYAPELTAHSGAATIVVE